MKSFANSIVIASLGLLSAISAQASVDSILRIDLKCYVQQSTSTRGSNDYGDVRLFRLDAKQLIAMAGKAAGRKFPDGGQLKAAVDGSVSVTDSKGKKIADITKYIRVKLKSDQRIFDGKANRETGVEGSRNYFPVALILNLPGLKASVEGVGVEDYHMTSPNRDGVQIITGDIDCNVNGKGAVDGKLAYLIGNLDLNGREAVLNN